MKKKNNFSKSVSKDYNIVILYNLCKHELEKLEQDLT